MKRTALVFLCLVASLGISLSTAWAEGEGHYELFQGKYPRYDGRQGASTEVQDVFLLDTVTGDVSVLVSSLDEKGRRVRYWEPASVDETKGPLGN